MILASIKVIIIKMKLWCHHGHYCIAKYRLPENDERTAKKTKNRPKRGASISKSDILVIWATFVRITITDFVIVLILEFEKGF